MIQVPPGAPAARLASAFGDELPVAIAQRLLDRPDLRARLPALLDRRLGLSGRSDVVHRLLSSDDDAVGELCRQVGIAWHAASVLRILDGARIRELATRLGFDPRPLALRFVSGIEVPAVSEDQLPDALNADGGGCVAAWCETLDVVSRAVVALFLPAGARAGTLHAAQGPALVRAVLDEAAFV